MDASRPEEDPVVAPTHAQMMREGLKSAKTKMSRISEDDEEGRISHHSRPKSQIKPGAIAGLLGEDDDEDRSGPSRAKSRRGDDDEHNDRTEGSKSRSKSRGRKSRKGKSKGSRSRGDAMIEPEDPEKAL